VWKRVTNDWILAIPNRIGASGALSLSPRALIARSSGGRIVGAMRCRCYNDVDHAVTANVSTSDESPIVNVEDRVRGTPNTPRPF